MCFPFEEIRSISLQLSRGLMNTLPPGFPACWDSSDWRPGLFMSKEWEMPSSPR